MMTPLLIIAVLGQVSDSAELGSITSTMGRVTMQRNGQLYRAEWGSGVSDGDHFNTSSQAGVSMYLDGGQLLYIGSDSVATV